MPLYGQRVTVPDSVSRRSARRRAGGTSASAAGLEQRDGTARLRQQLAVALHPHVALALDRVDALARVARVHEDLRRLLEPLARCRPTGTSTCPPPRPARRAGREPQPRPPGRRRRRREGVGRQRARAVAESSSARRLSATQASPAATRIQRAWAPGTASGMRMSKAGGPGMARAYPCEALRFPPMRAIRITEWGGPEVLELVEDAPRPAGRRAPRPRPRHARRDQLRRHPRAREHLPRALRAPVHARAPRSPAWSRRTGRGFDAGQRVVALVGTGGYAEYVAAPAATTIAVPDGVSDATALGLLLQGLTAWHLYATSAKLAAGRERRRARRRRRGRLARRPARQAAGRGPRDRHRVDGGEAGARARAGRRRRGRRHARGPRGRARGGQPRRARRRRARDGRRPRVRRRASTRSRRSAAS